MAVTNNGMGTFFFVGGGVMVRGLGCGWRPNGVVPRAQDKGYMLNLTIRRTRRHPPIAQQTMTLSTINEYSGVLSLSGLGGVTVLGGESYGPLRYYFLT